MSEPLMATHPKGSIACQPINPCATLVCCWLRVPYRRHAVGDGLGKSSSGSGMCEVEGSVVRR